MERYLRQLLSDIRMAEENVPDPWWHFVDAAEDDDEPPPPWMENLPQAPTKSLEEWTGLKQEQLPPAGRLNEYQVRRLLKALKKMLSAYNCHVVFQRSDVPESLQYEIIRRRFDQEVPQLRANDFFFSFCEPEQNQNDCPLGEFCECRYLDNMLFRLAEEEDDLSAEPEEFDLQENYLRRKYGHDHDAYRPYNDWEEGEDEFSEEDEADWPDEEEEDW